MPFRARAEERRTRRLAMQRGQSHRRPPCPTGILPRSRPRTPPPSSRAPKRGFSLLELLLAVALILLLSGAVIVNFVPHIDRSALPEAREQVVALVHLARAHAATSGHRVRLSFSRTASPDPFADASAPTWELGLSEESNPLGAPGRFEPLPSTRWNLLQLNERVTVAGAPPDAAPLPSAATSTRPSQFSDESSPQADTAIPAAAAPSDVTFYPDGSCDSADFTIVSRHADDLRRLRIRLHGPTGRVHASLNNPALAAQDNEDATAEDTALNVETPPNEPPPL